MSKPKVFRNFVIHVKKYLHDVSEWHFKFFGVQEKSLVKMDQRSDILWSDRVTDWKYWSLRLAKKLRILDLGLW